MVLLKAHQQTKINGDVSPEFINLLVQVTLYDLMLNLDLQKVNADIELYQYYQLPVTSDHDLEGNFTQTLFLRNYFL